MSSYGNIPAPSLPDSIKGCDICPDWQLTKVCDCNSFCIYMLDLTGSNFIEICKEMASQSYNHPFHFESCLVCSLEPVCAFTYTHKYMHKHRGWEGSLFLNETQVMEKTIRREREQQRKLEVSLQAETKKIKYWSHSQDAGPNQYQQTQIQLLVALFIFFLQYILIHPSVQHSASPIQYIFASSKKSSTLFCLQSLLWLSSVMKFN